MWNVLFLCQRGCIRWGAPSDELDLLRFVGPMNTLILLAIKNIENLFKNFQDSNQTKWSTIGLMLIFPLRQLVSLISHSYDHFHHKIADCCMNNIKIWARSCISSRDMSRGDEGECLNGLCVKIGYREQNGTESLEGSSSLAEVFRVFLSEVIWLVEEI